jgi:hypothetical protein
MTSPWSALDADAHPQTGQPTLFLDPSLSLKLNNAYTPYQQSLQTLIDDRLDNTSQYFGTPANPLASLLEQAFNSRGSTLTTYLTQQLSQADDFVKTAQDAAAATTAYDTA